MSYRFLSPNTGMVQSLTQWESRTLEGELVSFESRSIVRVFDRHLSGKHMRLLEGGCGLGAWCKWFERQGHKVVGVDNCESILRNAKALEPDIDVEYGDVADLMYPDDSFDVYVSLGVVEHFEDGPVQVLREAHRVLKSGGLAFVSTPYRSPLRLLVSHPIRSLYFFIRKLRGQPSYFWEYRFSKQRLERHIEEAGFEIVETAVDDFEPHVRDRHMGLWADWFFLRKVNGEIWELNEKGKLVLRLLKIFPHSWYASGIVVVARAAKTM